MRPSLENILVLIPARKGSKGVPNKNSKVFSDGKSLVDLALACAKDVFPSSRIMLSTDDEGLQDKYTSDAILIRKRPEELANDGSGMLPVMLDAIENCGFNPTFLLLLQPTSPLRTAEDLKEAINLFQEEDHAVIAVNQPAGNPFYTLFTKSGDYLSKYVRNAAVTRQELPEVYDVNGMLYLFRAELLKEKTWTEFERLRPYVVSRYRAIDIDNHEDWKVAQLLFQNQIF